MYAACWSILTGVEGGGDRESPNRIIYLLIEVGVRRQYLLYGHRYVGDISIGVLGKFLSNTQSIGLYVN